MAESRGASRRARPARKTWAPTQNPKIHPHPNPDPNIAIAIASIVMIANSISSIITHITIIIYISTTVFISSIIGSLKFVLGRILQLTWVLICSAWGSGKHVGAWNSQAWTRLCFMPSKPSRKTLNLGPLDLKSFQGTQTLRTMESVSAEDPNPSSRAPKINTKSPKS